MSMINEELQKQERADMGAVMKKLLGGSVPVIDSRAVDEEERRVLELAHKRLMGAEETKSG